jgi:hypothetical protein
MSSQESVARTVRLQCLWLAFLVIPPMLLAQSPSRKSDDKPEHLKHAFYEVAADYEITIGTGRELQHLPLRDEPIMHWLSLDGSKGTYVGSVFVWTRLKRPEVVGTIFTWDGDNVRMPGCEELYSYSMEQMLVRSGKGKVWRPAPCKHMQLLPNAPPPAATEQGRRLQLRRMSREFSGRMNRLGVHHPLRLLPRPVYEYECEDPDVLGGALFVLVAYVTDPDILLLIEARQTAEGPKWFFQPARFSDKSLWLEFQKKNIWTSQRLGHGTDKQHAVDPQYHVEYVKINAPFNRK